MCQYNKFSFKTFLSQAMTVARHTSLIVIYSLWYSMNSIDLTFFLLNTCHSGMHRTDSAFSTAHKHVKRLSSHFLHFFIFWVTCWWQSKTDCSTFKVKYVHVCTWQGALKDCGLLEYYFILVHIVFFIRNSVIISTVYLYTMCLAPSTLQLNKNNWTSLFSITYYIEMIRKKVNQLDFSRYTLQRFKLNQQYILY